MRRSRFLWAGACGMFATQLPQLAGRARAAPILDYTITAAPLTFSPGDGSTFAGLAFNGSLPGRVLRVTHGQRIRVLFRNRAGKPSTIHWHGMILPNAMDGVEYVTQLPVPHGSSFTYEFMPDPPGTRWYHDHVVPGSMRGLFGMFIVEDPRDEPADAEFALVFHDVPRLQSAQAAMRGTSNAPMTDPMGSPEMQHMRMSDKMGDEVAYRTHCINGRTYPHTKPLLVKVGDRVRLRVLNANPTQTRYVRLAGHRLRVTHSDGNPLLAPVEVDALRVGVAERYDAWFEVTKPGAWLLQGISSDPLAFEQAVVVHTPGMENAAPQGNPQSLVGVEYFSYQKAGGRANSSRSAPADQRFAFVLGGGDYGSSQWTINGKTWPNTPKIHARRGERIAVHFTNKTDMDHPMHLHGHVFNVTEVNGTFLARPLPKDTALVPANGGTLTFEFAATSPAGRWVLHCHNDVHMMDGMMTEVVYTS